MAKSSTTLSGALLTRAVGMLLIICLAECAAGSCLSYGHSCWGAHGKRSSSRTPNPQGVAPEAQRPLSLGDRWFLSRLLHPDLKRPTLPVMAFALNNQPLDATSEAAIWQNRHGLRENFDTNEDRRGFNAGKILMPENIDQQSLDEQLSADLLTMDDLLARPDRINLMKMVKENNAGLQ